MASTVGTFCIADHNFLEGRNDCKMRIQSRKHTIPTDKTGLDAVQLLENVSFSDVAKFSLENVRGEENEKSLGFTSL